MNSDRTAIQAASISILVGSLICGLKFFGFLLTGSQAIFSDALESIINVLAALFSAYTIREARGGADRNHPYGKGRFEYFSAGFEGGLIALAGLLILYESIPKIIVPKPIRDLDLGLLFTVIATAGNAALALYLIRTGKKQHSDALVADGHHILSDVVTSIGLIFGLIVVYFTDFERLDPIIASVMAFWILFSGFRILKASFYRLVDRVSPETLSSLVVAMKESRTPAMILPHRLRLRESGPSIMLDFHLVVPRYFTVETIHDIETAFAEELKKKLNREVDLMIHTDPCISDNCHLCIMPDCPVRAAETENSPVWTEEFLLNDIDHPYEMGHGGGLEIPKKGKKKKKRG